MKRFIVFLSFICMLALGSTQIASATAPYRTMTWDPVYRLRETTDAYLPGTVIERFGETELRSPQDIAISRDNHLYIADTGNKRVIKCLPDGTFIAEYGMDILEHPSGISVNSNNDLYVADWQNKKIYMFSDDGTLLREYGRPDSILYGLNNDFAPRKVAADESGNVFVISEGNTNGVIQLSPDGDFFGYIGANSTPLFLRELLQRFTFTDEQLNQLRLNVPVTPHNLTVDERGLVYTVTQGGGDDALKKFNLANKNMLGECWVENLVSAVCVGPVENIYTVTLDGFIFEYDREGNILFVFGGTDGGVYRDGLFTAAVGIAADSEGNLYVLDADQQRVTRFEQTEFSNTVHDALALYQSGLYLESMPFWEQSLQQDSLYTLAHRGMGESYYKLENYRAAMDSFRFSYAGTGYSNAFWEVRNEWMMNYLPYVFVGIALLVIGYRAIRAINRKTAFLAPAGKAVSFVTNRKIVRELAYMKEVPRNPADAFYSIKHEGKASVLSATIIYLLFFVIYIADKYASGFLFRRFIDNYDEIGVDILVVFGIIAAVVLCHHLVCSINEGEGSLKNIYICFAYCLTPYVLLKPFIIALTYVLTYNESFVITFGNVFIIAAVIILVIVKVKTIQDYSFWNTIKSLLLTIFTSLMLIVTLVIVFALVNQVIDFVYAVGMEVYFRAG